MSRISDIAVTDLPQPDSPTMASVSPSSTWKETPSTARLIPSGVRKWVCRFWTSSNAIGLESHFWSSAPSPEGALQAFGHSWIEGIAQAVAKQIDGEHGDRQKRGGKEYDVGLYLPQRPALGHDVAPGRNGGRRTGADKGQNRLHDHGTGTDISGLDHQRRQRVGQDVAQDDHRGSRAGRDRRIHIRLLAQ